MSTPALATLRSHIHVRLSQCWACCHFFYWLLQGCGGKLGPIRLQKHSQSAIRHKTDSVLHAT